MHLLRLGSAFFGLCLLAACSLDGESPFGDARPQRPDARDAGEADGATGSGGDASTNGDAIPDGGVELQKVTVRASAAPAACDAVCRDRKYACTPSCDFGAGPAAGARIYGSSGEKRDERALASCADAIPTSDADDSGKTRPLDAYECCCASKPHQRVPGPLRAQQSCDAFCAAKGLACDPYTQWDSEGAGPDDVAHVGGVFMVLSSSAGTRTFRADACTFVPDIEIPIDGAAWTLTRYVCGCI